MQMCKLTVSNKLIIFFSVTPFEVSVHSYWPKKTSAPNTWPVGDDGPMYYSRITGLPISELRQAKWQFDGATIRVYGVNFTNSEWLSTCGSSEDFEVACAFYEGRLYNVFIIIRELTPGDDGKEILFETESTSGEKKKSEVTIAVKGSFYYYFF